MLTIWNLHVNIKITNQTEKELIEMNLDQLLDSVEFNEWVEELEYYPTFKGNETLEDTGRFPQ